MKIVPKHLCMIAYKKNVVDLEDNMFAMDIQLMNLEEKNIMRKRMIAEI